MITKDTHTQTYILRNSFHRIDRIKSRFRLRRNMQVPTNYEIIDEALRIYDLYVTQQLAKCDEQMIANDGNVEAQQ
jgi:hypothetical protein